MRSYTIAVLLLVFSAHAAEEKPACKMLEVTDNCRLFNENRNAAVITMPDGSEIPNPLHIPMGTVSMNAPPMLPMNAGVDAIRDMHKKIIDDQVALLKAWNSLPWLKRVSDEFKVAFPSAMMSPQLQSWAAGKRDESNTYPLILPWPPGKSGAEFKNVSASELYAYLDGLPPAHKALIITQAKEAAKRMGANAYTGMGGYGSSTAPEIPTATAGQKQRIESAVEYVRQAMQNDILRGRRPEELSPEEKGHLQKIRTVRLAPLDVVRQSPHCMSRSSPAFYMPHEHAMYICPDMYKAPMANLVFVLGHEIGHSIDPCCGRSHLLAVNHNKLGEQMPDEVRAELSSNPELQLAVTELSTSGGPFSVPQYRTAIDGDRAEKRLQELGLIQIDGQRVTSDERDPNLKQWQCIERTAGIRPADERQLAVVADEAERLMRIHNSTGKDPAQAKQELLKRMQEYRYCITTPLGPSQVAEAASDASGTKVLGRWLTENPPKTDADRLAVVYMFGSAACTHPAVMQNSESLINNLHLVQSTMVMNREQRHPENILRLERILLTDPRVQRAMGCKADPKYNCFADETPGGSGPAGSPCERGVAR